MGRRASIALTAATVLMGVVLCASGCVVSPATSVSDEDAHARFTAVLDDAESIVGGEWSNRDDPTARECIIPLWMTGERFPGLRVGPSPLSADLAIDRVAQSWGEQGFALTRATVGDVLEVRAESGDGELFIFRVSETAMTLQGESECRPVDT